MAQDDSHFRLRLPIDLKERVEESARLHRRSINAEVVALLEHALNNKDAWMSDGRQMAETRERIDKIAAFIRTQIGDKEADKLGL